MTILLFLLIFSISYSVSSESGKRAVNNSIAREENRNIGPGLLVNSVIMVERALKGLPQPLVSENMLDFTRVGNSFPLA